MGECAEERGIELKFIQPGSPYQNGYVERFNKSYREEVLDAFSFTRIKEANALSQAWTWIYDNERPHKSLGYQPLISYVQQRLQSSAPSLLLPDQQYQWKSMLLSVTNQGEPSKG
jgi:putative transposase